MAPYLSILLLHFSYKGMDNLPATMTLGRRGHYASLRSSGGATGTAGRGGASEYLKS